MIVYNSDRDEEALINLRPELFLEKFDSTRELENFQNESLRPILKMQHNVVLDFLLLQKNIDLIMADNNNRSARESQLKSFINQPHLKDVLIGMIVGHFTQNELKFYGKFVKEINKRISQMLLQRFMDSF